MLRKTESFMSQLKKLSPSKISNVRRYLEMKVEVKSEVKSKEVSTMTKVTKKRNYGKGKIFRNRFFSLHGYSKESIMTNLNEIFGKNSTVIKKKDSVKAVAWSIGFKNNDTTKVDMEQVQSMIMAKVFHAEVDKDWHYSVYTSVDIENAEREDSRK